MLLSVLHSQEEQIFFQFCRFRFQFSGGHVHGFEDAFPFEHKNLLSQSTKHNKKSSLSRKGRFHNKSGRMEKAEHAARKAVQPHHKAKSPPHAVSLLVRLKSSVWYHIQSGVSRGKSSMR